VVTGRLAKQVVIHRTMKHLPHQIWLVHLARYFGFVHLCVIDWSDANWFCSITFDYYSPAPSIGYYAFIFLHSRFQQRRNIVPLYLQSSDQFGLYQCFRSKLQKLIRLKYSGSSVVSETAFFFNFSTYN
jgi:hypothetical protein